jgi:hypothetical protein
MAAHKPPLTIEQMLTTTQNIFVPTEVASVLNMNPHTIRVFARKAPHLLGFPVIVIGSRTRIPRVPFLKYLGYEVKNMEESNAHT